MFSTPTALHSRGRWVPGRLRARSGHRVYRAAVGPLAPRVRRGRFEAEGLHHQAPHVPTRPDHQPGGDHYRANVLKSHELE